MDPGPAGVDGAGPRTPRARGPRRLLVAGTAAVVVLLAVIAVLAIRLAGPPPAAKAATPRPAPPPGSLTVPVIYQRLAPSVVLVRSGHELGSGVTVADDGTPQLMTATDEHNGRREPLVDDRHGQAAGGRGGAGRRGH